MDGVIVDSMQYHANAWIEVFREYGLFLTREEVFKREGMSGVESIIDIFREKHFPTPSEQELKKLLEKKLEKFEKFIIDLFPYVKEILELVHKKGISIGLVTGSLKRSVKHVLPVDILQYFQTIVTVDDITNGKPHPEPYLRGLHMLGSNAKNTIAVENAPFGIMSAKAAGLVCYALETTLSKRLLSGADIIFHNHLALLKHFENIL